MSIFSLLVVSMMSHICRLASLLRVASIGLLMAMLAACSGNHLQDTDVNPSDDSSAFFSVDSQYRLHKWYSAAAEYSQYTADASQTFDKVSASFIDDEQQIKISGERVSLNDGPVTLNYDYKMRSWSLGGKVHIIDTPYLTFNANPAVRLLSYTLEAESNTGQRLRDDEFEIAPGVSAEVIIPLANDRISFDASNGVYYAGNSGVFIHWNLGIKVRVLEHLYLRAGMKKWTLGDGNDRGYFRRGRKRCTDEERACDDSYIELAARGAFAGLSFHF